MRGASGRLRIVSVFPTAQAAVDEAADRIAAYAENAIAARGRFSCCLAGGKTPLPLYRKLAGEPYRLTFPWSKTSVFFSDERSVAPESPESNYGSVARALFDHVALEPSRIHRMDAGRSDEDDAVLEYAAALHARLGPEGRLDLAILGMGSDGHAASLFPGSSALQEHDRWVVTTTAPDGARRMTLTLALLNRARHVLFFVVGRDKAAMAKRILRGGAEDMMMPAARVTSLGGIVQWILDSEAAAELMNGG